MRDATEILADEFKTAYPITYDAIYKRGSEQGYADGIDACAKIISKLTICDSCPTDCHCGTEKSCEEAWKVYLKEQLKEKK